MVAATHAQCMVRLATNLLVQTLAPWGSDAA